MIDRKPSETRTACWLCLVTLNFTDFNLYDHFLLIICCNCLPTLLCNVQYKLFGINFITKKTCNSTDFPYKLIFIIEEIYFPEIFVSCFDYHFQQQSWHFIQLKYIRLFVCQYCVYHMRETSFAPKIYFHWRLEVLIDF